MKTKLRTDHALFKKLKDNPPQWWKDLKADPELYVDIRKDNYLNVYHNGGSIMKLERKTKFKAQIHIEYIPLNRKDEYLAFRFENDIISLSETKSIDIKNFDKEPLGRIKKRVRQFYPDYSEKGIQAKYVIHNNSKNGSEDRNGFFIDTEFEYEKKRIDLIWVDLETKQIAFVELKTIGDKRLFIGKDSKLETIDKQLRKYRDFVCENKKDLIDYYAKVFSIKKELGILPEFVKVNSLEDYTLIEKPILLIGNCTQNWIDQFHKELNKQLTGIAFACLYQGTKTYNFSIPKKRSHNCFLLDGG